MRNAVLSFLYTSRACGMMAKLSTDFRNMGTPESSMVRKAQTENLNEVCWDKHRVVKVWNVENELDGLKLPEAIHKLNPSEFPTLSRSRKACRKGYVLLNGSTGRCIHKVQNGDIITLQERCIANYGPNVKVNPQLPFPYEIKILYECDDLALVFKPEGPPTTTPGGTGSYVVNVKTALTSFITPPSPDRACLRVPLHVHRLDAPTSGILCVAKTKPALINLQRAFAQRKVTKIYTAIVLGRPAQSHGFINSPIPMKIKGEKVMRQASSEYKILQEITLIPSNQNTEHNPLVLCLMELRPKTGRTHQLRIHTSRDLGCPIIGDAIYDKLGIGRKISQDRGLFLCATTLELAHPITQKPLSVSIEAPAKFADLMRNQGPYDFEDLYKVEYNNTGPSLEKEHDDEFDVVDELQEDR